MGGVKGLKDKVKKKSLDVQEEEVSQICKLNIYKDRFSGFWLRSSVNIYNENLAPRYYSSLILYIR